MERAFFEAGKALTELRDRLSKLWDNENLEEATKAVLKHLGELKRSYLTAVEEKLLKLLESEYGNNIKL